MVWLPRLLALADPQAVDSRPQPKQAMIDTSMGTLALDLSCAPNYVRTSFGSRRRYVTR